MSIAELIKSRRKALRMTQKDLAKLVGVHEQSVSDWETGTIPREEMQRKIVEALGFDGRMFDLIEQYVPTAKARSHEAIFNQLRELIAEARAAGVITSATLVL
jgi:transcriptional regulator with XRE-family HTH domain